MAHPRRATPGSEPPHDTSAPTLPKFSRFGFGEGVDTEPAPVLDSALPSPRRECTALSLHIPDPHRRLVPRAATLSVCSLYAPQVCHILSSATRTARTRVRPGPVPDGTRSTTLAASQSSRSAASQALSEKATPIPSTARHADAPACHADEPSRHDWLKAFLSESYRPVRHACPDHDSHRQFRHANHPISNFEDPSPIRNLLTCFLVGRNMVVIPDSKGAPG